MTSSILLLLALPLWAQFDSGISTSTIPKEDNAINLKNLGLSVRELQSGRPTITGLPTFQGGLISSGATTLSGEITSSGVNSWSKNNTFTGGVNISSANITETAPATPLGNRIYKDNIVKGWANINGNSNPASLNDSFNVSSLTDNGVGDYTINWATVFANVKYSIAGFAQDEASQSAMVDGVGTASLAAGTSRVARYQPFTNTLADGNNVCVIAIGDQ